MQITVKLFATFREGRFMREVRQYASGTRIETVVEQLDIDPSEIGMIMVNGRHAELHSELTEGVSLALFPLLGGG